MRRYFFRLVVVPLGDAVIVSIPIAVDAALGWPLVKHYIRKGIEAGAPPLSRDDIKWWAVLVPGACGAVYGLGFAVLRPALPRSTEAAGAAYVTGVGLAWWFGMRSAYRLVGQPYPPPTVLLRPRSLLKFVTNGLQGALLAEVERLV